MASDSTEVATGKARRERAQGERAEALQELLVSVDPDMAQWADGFIFGEVWGGPALSQDERQLVAITALACGGHMNHLRNYLHGAVQAGIPPQKLHEAIKMLVVYRGFPTTVNAMWEWRQVLASEHKKGRVSDEDVARIDRCQP